MLSKSQLQYIHQARRQAGVMDDAAWRLLLHNVAGVRSSKSLDNAAFEDVMSTHEEMGFRDRTKPGDFWRTKVKRQTADSRQIYMINLLARQFRYSVPQMCERFSNGRTQYAEKLTPAEARKLIEMMKAANRREMVKNSAGSYEPVPLLFDVSPPRRGGLFASRPQRHGA